MKRFNFTIPAYAILASLMVPAVASAEHWTRTPQREESVLTPPDAQLRANAQGKDKKFERNFTPNEKGDFVAPDAAASKVQLRAPRKTQSIIKKVEKAQQDAFIGNIYGVVNTFKGIGNNNISRCFWGKLDFEKSNVTPIHYGSFFTNPTDTDHQTGAVRNGILYIPNGVQSSVREFDVLWKRIDLETGKELPALNFGEKAIMWVQAMCYDPVTDSFVGMTVNDDTAGTMTPTRIVSINAQTFEPIILADFPDISGQVYSGFFFNPSDKSVYAYREDGNIYRLDRDSNDFIQVATIECADAKDEIVVLAPFNDRGTTNLVFSPKDNLVYLVANDLYNENEVYVYFIDLESGGYCERVCQLENNTALVSLYCPDSYALPEAANIPVISEFNLVKDDLKGSVKFSAPTTLYNELKLDKNVTTIATIDGKEVFKKEMAPGASDSFNFDVTEGIHELEIRCNISDELPGPVVSKRFFAGNDTPSVPTNLEINGNVISWTAPSAVGANKGYVDTDDLTYDVYFGTNKINKEPVKGNSFTFENPDQQTLVNITVKASAHGKTSEASEILPAIVGNSLSLPYTATPTLQQANLFTVVDSNGDGNTFYFDKGENAFSIELETYEGSNDWLVLPLLNFDSKDNMYRFQASFFNQTPYYGTETISICIGKDPEHLDRVIATYPNISSKEFEFPISLDFEVPEAGDYYIGIHANTRNESSGATISGISVEKLSASTAVPAIIADAKLEAAPKGKNEGIITFTAPTKDVAGNNLPADKEITFNVINTSQEKPADNSIKGKPGEKITLTCEAYKGFNIFKVYPQNEEGNGPSVILREFIGLDTPVAPENIKHVTSDDNLTMTISWDPVKDGVNGGYIDADNVTYQVWNNPQGVTWNRIGEPVSTTSVLFDPQYPTLARWKLAVLAQNPDGDFLKSSRLNYFAEQLGNPVTLPLNEPFGASGVAYPWNYDRDTDATEFSSFRQITTSELASLGIGNPKCEDGSARLLSSLVYGQSTEAHLHMPKFSTVGMNDPVFNLKLWNYERAPKFEVYARCAGSEELEKIATVENDPTNYLSWNDYMLPLPDKYKNKSWVQFQIHFYLPAGGNSYGVIDHIRVFENVDHDYKIDSIVLDGSDYTYVGKTSEFLISQTNGGLEDGNASVTVTVYGDGTQLASNTYDIARFRSYSTRVMRMPFIAKTDYLKYKEITIKATITGEGDNIDINNSKEIKWNILRPTTPIIEDLSGSRSDDKEHVQLNWSMPDLSYGNFDDFEYLEPFSIDEKLGQWTNIDEDGFPTFSVSGLIENWPHTSEPRGWQVINAEMLGVEKDDRFKAPSGKQYLGAFAGWDPENEDEQVQVADWLISPEVVGGTDVSFWMNNISTDYRETIHVMVSSTDNKPESFTKLCNRSKEGSDSWGLAEFTLPEDAKYFALKYVGWNTLGVLVDDIKFTPVTLDSWEIDGFYVYRKFDSEDAYTCIAKTNDLSYIDNCGDTDNVQYVIVPSAVYNGVKVTCPDSNMARVYASSVDGLEDINGISGGNGEIRFSALQGKTAVVYTADGKLVKSVKVNSDNFATAIDAGIYLVKVGEVFAKIVVK